MKQNAVILYGTGYGAFAKKVSDITKIPLAKQELGQFSDGSPHPLILETYGPNTIPFIISSAQSNVGSSDATFMAQEALNLAEISQASGAARAIPILMLYPFSRGDRPIFPNQDGELIIEPVPIKGHLRSLSTHSRCIFTIDLHSAASVIATDVPFYDLHLANYLTRKITEKRDIGQISLVNPDSGAAGRTKHLDDILGIEEVINANKYRQHGVLSKVEFDSSRLPGRIILIVEDMIDTGNTLIEMISKCLNIDVKEVLVVATHAMFNKESLRRFSEITDKRLHIMVSNTITQQTQLPDSIQVLEIEKYIAELIIRLVSNQGIDDFLTGSVDDRFFV